MAGAMRARLTVEKLGGCRTQSAVGPDEVIAP